MWNNYRCCCFVLLSATNYYNRLHRHNEMKHAAVEYKFCAKKRIAGYFISGYTVPELQVILSPVTPYHEAMFYKFETFTFLKRNCME